MNSAHGSQEFKGKLFFVSRSTLTVASPLIVSPVRTRSHVRILPGSPETSYICGLLFNYLYQWGDVALLNVKTS